MPIIQTVSNNNDEKHTKNRKNILNAIGNT